MSDLTSDLNLRWAVESDVAVGFATAADLRLGDALLSPSIDKQFYLDSAWLEIESVLGTCYVVPVTDNIPQAARNQLTHIHAMLASSWLLMELNAGNDSDQASFAMWLRKEVDRKLDVMCNGSMDLDGLERIIDEEKFDEATGFATNVPTIITADCVSPFQTFNAFTSGYSPSPWAPDESRAAPLPAAARSDSDETIFVDVEGGTL